MPMTVPAAVAFVLCRPKIVFCAMVTLDTDWPTLIPSIDARGPVPVPTFVVRLRTVFDVNVQLVAMAQFRPIVWEVEFVADKLIEPATLPPAILDVAFQ